MRLNMRSTTSADLRSVFRQLVTGCLPPTPDTPENPNKWRSLMIVPPNLAPGRSGLSPETLRAKAVELEAAFLAEMLGHAGLGSADGTMGGGIGEAQFASFLREEQAMGLARRGGIGLAEQLFRAMTAGAADAG